MQISKYTLSLISCLLIFMGCSSPNDSSKADPKLTQKTVKVESPQKNETARMVEELKLIATNGDIEKNIYQNKRLAQSYRSKIKNAPPKEKRKLWFNYCYQLLLAGETEECIKQLTPFFGKAEFPFKEELNPSNKSVFEMLALAYLRLGERQNCQANHSPQSCIIPFQKGGIHQLKEGSEKAIELYEVLHEQFPSPMYKWVLNVAHMTLGNYPKNIPSKYRLKIPADREQSNFPAFKDIAMDVGLAQDGFAGGVCIDDFNNDGFLDIFMTSNAVADNVQLYINDQKGGYTNTTQAAGLKGIVGGFNCIQADYDNDGFKDILVLRGAWLQDAGKHPNSLLKNMGDGTFKDVSRSSGLLSYHPTQTAAWADFNKDGFLDLFIGNESRPFDPHPSELFKNNGDGTFSEVAASYGLGRVSLFVKSVAWGDINNDGWPDLYISRLGGRNLLFKNVKGIFSEIGKEAGVDKPLQSFPCWFWDVNNDGLEDLLALTYDLSEPGMAGQYALELQDLPIAAEKPRLYINNGDETFTESSEKYGISRPMAAMGSNFGDIDNDGYLDFYVGTGAPFYTDIIPNRMFRNVDGERFEEVTSAGNFGHIQKGHGIAFADMDRDGDQDIYAVMGGFYEGDNFTNILYENPISKNNWIIIDLQGTTSNRNAIGAKIEVKLSDGRTLYRSVSSGGSFGASPLQREIGLGKSTAIETLKIRWPNGKNQEFQNIDINQKILITEGDPAFQSMDYKSTAFQSMNMHH